MQAACFLVCCRTGARAADAAHRLLVGPVDALAPVLLAALHEAATAIADGADGDALRRVIEELIARVTTAPQ